jgi:hypothetical protein
MPAAEKGGTGFPAGHHCGRMGINPSRKTITTDARMDILAFLAEQKILQAMEERDLSDCQFKYKPLPMEDDSFVPPELKIAYKILKNGGFLPPEVEERKEIRRLEDLITATEDEHERLRQMKKLEVLMMKIDAKRSFSTSITSQHEYYRNIVERITLRSKQPQDDSPVGPDRKRGPRETP